MAMDQHSAISGDSESQELQQQPRQSEALLQDLRRKLDDLEDKVQACRHDMAAEFQGYYQQTLLDAAVPRETVLAVQQSLALSLENCYPILALELRKQLPTIDTSTRTAIQKTHKAAADSLELPSRPNGFPAGSADLGPSPPSSGTVFGAAVASSSPHEREKEFQGLFTPFFLPLLDSTPISPNISTTSPPLQPPSATATPASPSLVEPVVTGTGPDVATSDQMQGSSGHLQGQDMEGSSETRGVQKGSTGTSPPTSPTPLPSRPSPHTRRETDDTLSSVLSSALSDRSETAAPKSALRRSSSCSRPPQQSPRRVRFEVKGAEVLPTASPQPSDFPTPRPSSSIAADQPRSFDEIVGDNNFNDDDRPSLPPRKISSTEKLRMLSREPLDSTTTWTTVNIGAEDSEEQSSAASSFNSKTTSPGQTPISSALEPATQSGFGKPAPAVRTVEDSDESSDEDFLAMAKPKSKTKKIVPATTTTSNTAPRQEPPAKPNTQAEKPVKEEEEKDQTSSEDYEEEDDDMFHFETGGLSAPPRPRKRPTPLKEDAPEPTTPAFGREGEVRTPQIASPGVIIPAQTGSGPPTPTASRFQIGSLGSYKGRPVVMPVVKNPELHAQAAEQGEFNTFVGGVDGRSGVDDGDMNSFRASLAQTGFSGTPRSLSERMMMEDAMEERKKNGTS